MSDSTTAEVKKAKKTGLVYGCGSYYCAYCGMAMRKEQHTIDQLKLHQHFTVRCGSADCCQYGVRLIVMPTELEEAAE